MTFDEITKVLSDHEAKTGIPFAYYEFNKAPGSDRYIAYYEDAPDQFGADDQVYYSNGHFTIELYTPHKEPETEAILTGFFDVAGIFWTKSAQAKIDSEDMFQTVFNV